MMKLLSKTKLVAAALMSASAASSQSHAVTSSPDSTITMVINSSGVIAVSHPEALELRLRKTSVREDTVESEAPVANTGRVRKMGGYRVQIYSDNNARTAKNEARAKERTIAGSYPELATYVIYDSPYWRLRVGDCRTRAEAEELASELKKAFPAYRAEITVVRDRINAVN